jgi:maltose alpha-D-glucosyltransferase/alpha-amylase
MVFPGVQDSTWSYDEAAGEWYLHRFYPHQPDLNIANPAVREEITKIMGFWLQLGVSGFRLDALPFLIEYKGIERDEHPQESPHAYLTELRDFISWRKAEGMLLAEANVTVDEIDEYFGSGDRMHMLFNFMLNQHVFLAFARGDADPIRQVLQSTPKIPATAQWASFLRNHDEIDLGRLSDAERAEAFAAFGPDPAMQLYGRGVRRRLAPMFDGDLRRLRMAYSLMFALPGTPVLWYGEEIGMGEDLSLPERNSVRTPMQWDDEPNAGFSTAEADQLIRPVVRGGAFGYENVNVAAQRDKPGSLMQDLQRLIRTRRSCPEVGWGEWQLIDTHETSVLALRYSWRGQGVLTLHNLADRNVEVRLDLGEGSPRLLPLHGDTDDRTRRSAAEPVQLDGYGYRWFRLYGERR